MATPGGGGSHLAALAARRASLEKARSRLAISDTGGAAGARPQANVKAVAPPPKAPATPTAPAPSGVPAPAPGGDGTTRDPAMLQQAQNFIEQYRAQGKEVTPAPTGVVTPPPSLSPSLSDQVRSVGAIGMSPYAQAMRIYGRPPGAREMVIFTAVQALEAQLGRPPTRNEVLMHITAPGGSNTTGPEPTIG